jgi:hypothetical protein
VAEEAGSAKKEEKGGEGKEDAEAAEEGAAAGPKLATFAFRVKMPDVMDQFLAAFNAVKPAAAGGKEEAGTKE